MEKSLQQTRVGIWPILALLRFILAMDILWFHSSQIIILPFPFELVHISGGAAAVLAFLIISGFSIAHSVTKETKGFYTRRIDRIYPLYFVAMILGIFTNFVNPPSEPITIGQWLGTPFFLNGFFVHRFPGIGPAWTLCIEVLFYALAPILIKLPTKALLGMIAASAFCFIHFGGSDYAYYARHGMGAVVLGWAWLLGFVFYRHQNENWAKGTLIAVAAFVSGRNSEEFCSGIVAASCAMMVFSPIVSIRVASIFLYLGDLSYPIYILHNPIQNFIEVGPLKHDWLLYILLPIVVSIAAYHLIDKPYRARARRLYNVKGSIVKPEISNSGLIGSPAVLDGVAAIVCNTKETTL